jgi:pyruvoyl-dependent arginine decarboxylase (PvlArgDC)
MPTIFLSSSEKRGRLMAAGICACANSQGERTSMMGAFSEKIWAIKAFFIGK